MHVKRAFKLKGIRVIHMSHFPTVVQLFMQHDRTTPPSPPPFFSVQYNKIKVADLAEVARISEHFLSVSLNSQMKSFIGTANMMPARAPGGRGGAEQHRPRLRKRAGRMGRNLSCAKSLDNCLETGRAWPSSSSLLKLLVVKSFLLH